MRRSRFSTSASSSSSWRSSVGIVRSVEATRLASALGSSTFVAASWSSAGRYGREADDLGEQALDVPGQRLDLGRVVVRVRQRVELADEVGLAVDRLDELDPVEAADEDRGASRRGS